MSKNIKINYIIDKQRLFDFRKALGETYFLKIYDQYIEEIEDNLSTLLTISNNEQSVCPKFARIAHRLAGSCAIFGADKLHGSLIILENEARGRAPNSLKNEIEEIIKLWKDTRATIDNYIDA